MRKKQWCYYFSPGLRFLSLFVSTLNNWGLMSWAPVGGPSSLVFTINLSFALPSGSSICWPTCRRSIPFVSPHAHPSGSSGDFAVKYLPILSYSASVCHVPATSFQDQFTHLISRFLCKYRSKIALSKNWRFLLPGQDSLGLTKVCDMVQNLQAHMLCKIILAARAHTFMGLPTWVDPVIRLFDQAISPYGHAFDILYAPIATGPGSPMSSSPRRWSSLGPYWHSALFV